MEKLIAHTPIFDLVKKQDEMNTIGFDPVGINSTDWIIIIVEQNGQWLMVKQLRYGLMQECEEFCSGMIDEGEHPRLAARRELEEETEIEGRINKVGAIIVFVVIGMMAVFIFVGTRQYKEQHWMTH